MQEDNKYYKILKATYNHYLPYLTNNGDNEVQLIDPVDKKVIGFHYGETHMGVAFILGGVHFKNDAIRDMGYRIINGFVNHVTDYQKDPAYHWDFNNFALCVLYEYLDKTDVEFCKRIKKFIISQQDSNNATINWYPMRLYVNWWKYQWTGEKKYKAIMCDFKKRISSAQYADGYIEDLLPKGTSFNFQYHMFTTSLLAFLKLRDIDVANVSSAVSRTEDMMDYQGDINYLGRGNNQIFAWGPAIYLYSVLEDQTSYNKAIEYVYDRAFTSIENDNLILNDFEGSDKNWWWDYHYCSVYIAHFIFWLMLAAIEQKKLPYKYEINNLSDSGVHIHKGNYCVVIFDGRRHYLAESGKIIAGITDRKGMCYFKGAFGPHYKEYGFKYAAPSDSFHNFIGIMKQENIFGRFVQKPVYPDKIGIVEDNELVRISIKYKRNNRGIVNLPLFTETSRVKVFDGFGNEIFIRLNRVFKGPYGMVNLYQSGEITVDRIIIEIGSMETNMKWGKS